MHSRGAWSVIITAIVLVLPNKNHKARGVYFFFGTLVFALAAGASAAGTGGLAPLLGVGAPLVGGLGTAPEAAPPVVGAPVLAAFFAAAIVYYLHERKTQYHETVSSLTNNSKLTFLIHDETIVTGCGKCRFIKYNSALVPLTCFVSF